MPQKSKARRGKKEDRGESKEKTQAQRFIETARAIGIDETGKEFERALRKIVPTAGKSAKKDRAAS